MTGCVLTGAALAGVDARRANMGAMTLRWADASAAKLAGARLRQ